MFPTTKNKVVMLPGFLSGFRKYCYLGNVTLSRCFWKTIKTRLFVGVSCQMFTFVLKLVQRSNIRLTLLPILARQTVFLDMFVSHYCAVFPNSSKQDFGFGDCTKNISCLYFEFKEVSEMNIFHFPFITDAKLYQFVYVTLSQT